MTWLRGNLKLLLVGLPNATPLILLRIGLDEASALLCLAKFTLILTLVELHEHENGPLGAPSWSLAVGIGRRPHHLGRLTSS